MPPGRSKQGRDPDDTASCELRAAPTAVVVLSTVRKKEAKLVCSMIHPAMTVRSPVTKPARAPNSFWLFKLKRSHRHIGTKNRFITTKEDVNLMTFALHLEESVQQQPLLSDRRYV